MEIDRDKPIEFSAERNKTEHGREMKMGAFWRVIRSASSLSLLNGYCAPTHSGRSKWIGSLHSKLIHMQTQ